MRWLQVLLPLVNVPMLEYSLEFLASNNVEEVFVFCCSKADMVKEYLVKSKWNVVPDEDESDDECEGKAGSSVGPDIYILTAQSVTSAGDALREIDSMGVIQSNPFVLVSGDVISNMDLNVCRLEGRVVRCLSCLLLIAVVCGVCWRAECGGNAPGSSQEGLDHVDDHGVQESGHQPPHACP